MRMCQCLAFAKHQILTASMSQEFKKVIVDPRKHENEDVEKTNTMVFIQDTDLIDCQDAENRQYYV